MTGSSPRTLAPPSPPSKDTDGETDHSMSTNAFTKPTCQLENCFLAWWQTAIIRRTTQDNPLQNSCQPRMCKNMHNKRQSPNTTKKEEKQNHSQSRDVHSNQHLFAAMTCTYSPHLTYCTNAAPNASPIGLHTQCTPQKATFLKSLNTSLTGRGNIYRYHRAISQGPQ